MEFIIIPTVLLRFGTSKFTIWDIPYSKIILPGIVFSEVDYQIFYFLLSIIILLAKEPKAENSKC